MRIAIVVPANADYQVTSVQNRYGCKASNPKSPKEAFTMRIGRLAKQFQHSMMVLVLMGVGPGGALEQGGHSHEATAQPQQLTPAQGALLKIVREHTERFKDVPVAEGEGYSLLFDCVSGPDAVAMGLHYVNLSLVAAGVVDATRPQIVIYEPMPDGHLYLVPSSGPWSARLRSTMPPAESLRSVRTRTMHRLTLIALLPPRLVTWRMNMEQRT